jgi:hypothetical protein
MNLDSESVIMRKSVLWIYSNMVTSPTQKDNLILIDAFFQQAPIQKIAECGLDNQSLEVREEAGWVMANIINCGSVYQAKTMYELSNIQNEGVEENMLIKSFIKFVNTSHNESLVDNVLDALKKLAEVDEIYELKLEDSILENFIHNSGIEALDACILRFAASDLD